VALQERFHLKWAEGKIVSNWQAVGNTLCAEKSNPLDIVQLKCET